MVLHRSRASSVEIVPDSGRVASHAGGLLVQGGLGKLPAQASELNEAWLCAALLAASLLRWSKPKPYPKNRSHRRVRLTPAASPNFGDGSPVVRGRSGAHCRRPRGRVRRRAAGAGRRP